VLTATPIRRGAMPMLSEEFVRSYIAAWNERDPSQVAGHLAPNGTYHDMGEQRQVSRQDFIAHLEDYFVRQSNRYTLVGEILEGRNTIAFQYLAFPARGADRDRGWMGAEFITLEGDRASRIEDYYRDPHLADRDRRSRPAAGRYAKSGLSPAAQEAVLRRLAEAMEVDRSYLNSHLSLPELAANIGCSVNHLSQAINEGHGVSFFDFVNRYRIVEATRMLSLREPDEPSILDVALAVGFNSTSTFYAAFKRVTGKTPAQYRREASGGH
jgi:AraC-like DNA-binding protein